MALKVIDQPEMSSGSSASAKLLRAMLAAIAEFELSLIRDRMSEGRKRAKGAGVKFGRPRKLDDKTAKLVQGLKREREAERPRDQHQDWLIRGQRLPGAFNIRATSSH